MTTPDTTPTQAEPRRATDEEIRTARAWVDETLPAWTDDTDAERQAEYEHALEVLIFAHGGRYRSPAPAPGWVPLAEVLDALGAEGRRWEQQAKDNEAANDLDHDPSGHHARLTAQGWWSARMLLADRFGTKEQP